MKIKNILELVLFSSKWILVTFYFGLLISLGIFAYLNILEVHHLFVQVNTLNENDAMAALLNLIDLTMIANLIKMIIIGSYTSFVEKTPHKDDPNARTSSGVLKVKIATSLIGLSSINLLETFIREGVEPAEIKKKLIIHGAFLLGAVSLAIIDYLHVKAEVIHQEDKKH